MFTAATRLQSPSRPHGSALSLQTLGKGWGSPQHWPIADLCVCSPSSCPAVKQSSSRPVLTIWRGQSHEPGVDVAHSLSTEASGDCHTRNEMSDCVTTYPVSPLRSLLLPHRLRLVRVHSRVRAGMVGSRERWALVPGDAARLQYLVPAGGGRGAAGGV